jgi:hypothetical protein
MDTIAFHNTRRIASGPLREAALAAREVLERDPGAHVLLFDADTSRRIELDFRGDVEDLLERVDAIERPRPEQAPPSRRGPGRPRLGVVAREVTLLPRHWEWLGKQPGGASVALRRLVEQARKAPGNDRREAREIAYRFISQMAGDLPGFEEATRALFAGSEPGFRSATRKWPRDVRAHAFELADRTWPGEAESA